MTNAPMTDDPKWTELLATARKVRDEFFTRSDGHRVNAGKDADAFFSAIAAFDPPKPKQYTMPEWGELIKRDGVETGEKVYGGESGVAGWKGGWFTRDQYNAIRESLAE